MPEPPLLLLVIATYNEMENLPRLVEELQSRISGMHILIIDDNSPDGTGDWAEEESQTNRHLFVQHRPGKLGLGSAAIAGFKWGLERDYEWVATMDGDFSHRPIDMQKLVERSRSDRPQETGVFIGSRYIEGGQIVGWPWYRKWTSRILNLFARAALRLATRDNSGAMRVYRRRALDEIDLSKVGAEGYAYLEEILWRLQNAGVSFEEVPITFVDRKHGKSKTSIRIGLSVFVHLLKLAFTNPGRRSE